MLSIFFYVKEKGSVKEECAEWNTGLPDVFDGGPTQSGFPEPVCRDAKDSKECCLTEDDLWKRCYKTSLNVSLPIVRNKSVSLVN